jgi:hypothetical protein
MESPFLPTSPEKLSDRKTDLVEVTQDSQPEEEPKATQPIPNVNKGRKCLDYFLSQFGISVRL